MHNQKKTNLGKKCGDKLKIERWNISEDLYTKAKKFKKLRSFKFFIKHLPSEFLKTGIIELIEKNQIEFFSKLHSLNSVSDIKLSDYSDDFGYRMFSSSTVGIGKGEILISWLVKSAKISGISESFDIRCRKEKYEIKEYSKGNDGIRLGTKGNVTRYEFWNEIVETIQRLNKITRFTGKRIKLRKYFDKELVEIINQILSLQSKWLKGELYQSDLLILKKFYYSINQLRSNIDENYVTTVIFRGPNSEPIEIYIQPLHIDHIKSSNLNLKKLKRNSYDYILTELRRLKYVRNPEKLEEDINNTISNHIVGKIPFFVFRPDGPRIETEFTLKRISSGGMQIIEKRLVK